MYVSTYARAESNSGPTPTYSKYVRSKSNVKLMYISTYARAESNSGPTPTYSKYVRSKSSEE
jgi:predicted ATP-grasp superfamily ATP-dependent carboligase